MLDPRFRRRFIYVSSKKGGDLLLQAHAEVYLKFQEQGFSGYNRC